MLNWPTIFQTYQDVKNNLVYWTMALLAVSTPVVYFLFLDQGQRTILVNLANQIGPNQFLAGLAVVVSAALYAFLAYILIYVAEIHDNIYDKYIVQWRERYDVEFILRRLTKPFSDQLPRNFEELARKNHDEFMVPFYYYVGDRTHGIRENTRIRFYERVTKYWICQLNELTFVFFLIFTPSYILFVSAGSFDRSNLAMFWLVLVVLIITNRWFIRLSLRDTAQATAAEIDEILADPKYLEDLRKKYVELCNSHKS